MRLTILLFFNTTVPLHMFSGIECSLLLLLICFDVCSQDTFYHDSHPVLQMQKVFLRRKEGHGWDVHDGYCRWFRFFFLLWVLYFRPCRLTPSYALHFCFPLTGVWPLCFPTLSQQTVYPKIQVFLHEITEET